MTTATQARNQMERRYLLESMAASGCFGVLALVWGWASGSRVILFDGVAVLLGIALSAVSLLAANTAASAPTSRYPFGKQAAAPLVIGFQGAVLLGILTYALVEAVLLLTSGGDEVVPWTMLAYGLVSAALSALVVWRFAGPSAVSDIVAAEAAAWRAGVGMSLVVAVGGLVGVILAGSRWEAFVPYVDPLLLVILCAAIAPMALGLLRTSMRELLQAAPPRQLQQAVDAAATEVGEEFGLGRPNVIASKVGGRLYADVRYLIDADRDLSVTEEDQVRRAALRRLESTGLEVWANIEVTTDPQLAE